MREIVETGEAPAAIGPYSQGVRSGDLLFCSGQIALDPGLGELVKGDAADQTRRCLANLEGICRAAGTSLSAALRVTVYLTDMGEFERVNDVYADFFDAEPPARVTLGVAALPRGADVEVDAIVAAPGPVA